MDKDTLIILISLSFILLIISLLNAILESDLSEIAGWGVALVYASVYWREKIK